MRKIKPATKDFDISMLPKNRFDLFWDIIKNRSVLIFKTGLILLLFCIPFIVVCCVANLKVYDVNALVANGSVTGEEGAAQIFEITNSVNLLLVPASVIFALGICGICGIMRRLLWQEGVLFRADFSKSVKENALSFCAVAFILALCNYFLQYCVRLAYFNSSVWVQIAVGCCIVMSALSVFVSPLILAQSIIYKLSFSKKISNAFLLSMRMPHYALALAATNIAPFLLLSIDNTYVYIVCLILLPLSVMPLQILINMSVCDSILDKFVNKEHFPQIYKKGMYQNAADRNGKSE